MRGKSQSIVNEGKDLLFCSSERVSRLAKQCCAVVSIPPSVVQPQRSTTHTHHFIRRELLSTCAGAPWIHVFCAFPSGILPPTFQSENRAQQQPIECLRDRTPPPCSRHGAKASSHRESHADSLPVCTSLHAVATHQAHRRRLSRCSHLVSMSARLLLRKCKNVWVLLGMSGRSKSLSSLWL